ncbi:MAG: hypothetical protein FWG80_04375 [Alphaproteobacteria bacterium]|nr:hypothetical protein [Alphaproteobacteria bacterium]
MKKFLHYTFCLLPLIAGCAQNMERRLDDIRDDFKTSKFEKQKIGDRNLDPLLSGNALFQQDEFYESDAVFEEINKRMADAQGTSITGEVGKALTGQMAGSYKPYFMDDLFVSYYQIWAALAKGRNADARVIINQSYAKQQRLSQEYASLIKSREKDNNGLGSQLRGENAQWKSFNDIMNPALTYLAGIYFLNFATGASDYETARTYLSRAAGMAPNVKFIEDDIALARANKQPNGIVWIFVESGFAPKLKERRIDWPMFVGNSIRSVSIATSEPVFISDSPRIDDTYVLADIDAMFITEYKEYQINAALRALASAASKVALQSVAQNQLGPLGGLGAVVYSIATTSAEVRTWATLPKRIYVKRINKGVNNETLIELKSGGRVVSEIRLPKDGNNLIYFRWLGKDAKTKIIKLKG